MNLHLLNLADILALRDMYHSKMDDVKDMDQILDVPDHVLVRFPPELKFKHERAVDHRDKIMAFYDGRIELLTDEANRRIELLDWPDELKNPDWDYKLKKAKHEKKTS
jgi:hypothetical protein